MSDKYATYLLGGLIGDLSSLSRNRGLSPVESGIIPGRRHKSLNKAQGHLPAGQCEAEDRARSGSGATCG